MIKLSHLVDHLLIQQMEGDAQVGVTHLCLDSREASPGSLFVAIPGSKVDGFAYIADAIAAGSRVIVTEKMPTHKEAGITYIQVANAAQALGILASRFYGNPSQQIKVVAVTGTSGKTSIVHLLYGLFKQLGYRVGMLSTIHNKINDQILASTLTTPDALYLHQTLAEMVEAGCQYCFMEASSHALVQNRLAGLELAGGVFLNISHDHLDYHLNFDAYIQAKKKLFDILPAKAFALYNADDKRGKIMIQNTKATTYSFAMRSPGDYTAQIMNNTWQGLELRIAGQYVWFQLLGSMNGYNLLAAYATAHLLDQPSHDILVALSTIPPIPGRFQHIQTPQQVDIIIDYAHKPEALEKVLLAIQQIREQTQQKSRIITVIGCGGNRDTQKRPLMAKIAYKLSDQLIFTSDNPRYEEPQAIIKDMKQGLTTDQELRTLTILDRTAAIKTAYQMAQPHDILLIAGKGHEEYQEIAGVKYPLRDEGVIRSLINDATS